MTIDSLPVRVATLLACITSTIAQQLPYNPTYLIRGDSSKVYIFAPTTTPQFAVYDATNSINGADAPEALTSSLPFLSNTTNSFVPVATRNGLTVFSGECSEGDQELDLWTYGLGVNNKTWTQMQTTSSDPSLGANYLSAAFSFPDAEQQDVDSMYVFGGMCPNGTNDPSNWATNAAYSNTMLTISPDKSQDYEVSLTGQRAPPIAEAGLTITPLVPSRLAQDGPPQQQNFVLIGGHTQSAFINMSQVALFSMPESAWAFVDINQPADVVVEPRSGHTAVMSQDGSRIYIFGGWVGAVSNPATPQLAILEVGAGYGGNGSWSWTVPDQSTVKQYSGDYGVYGHAATMLPGDIMMVTAGLPISSKTGSQKKRDDITFQTKFYNTSSSTWDTSYTNPVTMAATKHSISGLSSSAKTGLGTGLGIGIVAVLLILAILFFYARRRRQRRTIREKQLREMALGTDRGLSTDADNSRAASKSVLSSYRSASWGSRQEQNIEGKGSYPTCRQVTPEDVAHDEHRTYGPGGFLDVPNPNRGLRTSLRGRGPAGYGPQAYATSTTSGAVFTIEEEEERSQKGSLRRPATASSRPLSDPFKDPPANPQADEAAVQRRQEVQTWVEDWESAAESMNIERSASKGHSRTYSNLSNYHSASSGDKSDRSNSNLSERSNVSMLSIQKSNAGTLSRSISQRSASAGYALFSTAAAAMGRITGRQDHGTLDRSASKRSISTGDLAQLKARKRANSVEQSLPPPIPIMETITPRDEASGNDYFTPPQSPIKDYKNHSRRRSNSLTNQSKKALNVLGQATKRVLTGTSTVSVSSKVEKFENNNSPTRDLDGPEMAEVHDRRAVSSGAAFWRHKQGAKDWEDPQLESSGTIRRRSSRVHREIDMDDDLADDWDVETAIQQRVVQVMFTVPKEKLRVVNADALSMISRSDTNASKDSQTNEESKDVNRMSRVTETGEPDEGSTLVGSSLHPDSAGNMKGKEKTIERTESGSSGATIGKAL